MRRVEFYRSRFTRVLLRDSLTLSPLSVLATVGGKRRGREGEEVTGAESKRGKGGRRDRERGTTSDWKCVRFSVDALLASHSDWPEIHSGRLRNIWFSIFLFLFSHFFVFLSF